MVAQPTALISRGCAVSLCLQSNMGNVCEGVSIWALGHSACHLITSWALSNASKKKVGL